MTALSAMSHLRALVIQPCAGCQRNHCDCPDAVWLGIVPSPSLGTVPLPLSDGPNLPPAANGVPGEHCDSPAAR